MQKDSPSEKPLASTISFAMSAMREHSTCRKTLILVTKKINAAINLKSWKSKKNLQRHKLTTEYRQIERNDKSHGEYNYK